MLQGQIPALQVSHGERRHAPCSPCSPHCEASPSAQGRGEDQETNPETLWQHPGMLSLGRSRSRFSMDTWTRILKRIITAAGSGPNSLIPGISEARTCLHKLPEIIPQHRAPCSTRLVLPDPPYQMAQQHSRWPIHPGFHPELLLGAWNPSCAHNRNCASTGDGGWVQLLPWQAQQG